MYFLIRRLSQLLGPLAVLPLVAAFGIACDDTQDHGAQRSDSAGVMVVVNTAPDRPLEWSQTPLIQLGGEDDGPEAFFEVSRPLVSFDDRSRTQARNY